MMNWVKKGLIFQPDPSLWWSRKYALYPTPVYIKDKNLLRIFFGCVDENMFGRISFIDLDPSDPSHIIYDPKKYVLDLGEKGAFDDCGVSPASVVSIGNQTFLYYSGFCRSFQSPYHIFSGLAVIDANGQCERYTDVPILDRTKGEYFDKAGQVVIEEDGIFKTWYVSGLRWETITSSLYTNKQMPVHVIRYGESKDGIHWKTYPHICIDFATEEEFGFGRPWVIKDGEVYKMWYSIRSRNLPYRLGYAESADGVHWTRMDEKISLRVSDDGWDSGMICYAAVISLEGKTYMFYNGNNHGETGFGYAQLEKA